MSRKFLKGFATVFEENGFHKVMLPNGEVIPHQLKSVVTCKSGKKLASAKMEFAVNIASSKEEALENYKKD